MKKELKLKSRVETGLAGSVLQSIRRGLAWEHQMVEGSVDPVANAAAIERTEADDMGAQFLGDVTITTQAAPQPPQSPASNKLGTAAALTAALLGSGALGYYLNKPEPSPAPAQQEFLDTDTRSRIIIDHD